MEGAFCMPVVNGFVCGTSDAFDATSIFGHTFDYDRASAGRR
jgi:hypothetical protein